MTDKEILANAIDKAIANGFIYTQNTMISLAMNENSISYHYMISIILSHSFAKVFWGEELVCSSCFKKLKEKGCVGSEAIGKHHIYTIVSWQGHLQQMILEEEPLKYLEKFL